MSNKILSITERVPHPSELPDGAYIGTWGGYIITLTYGNRQYELRTQEGVRGVGIRVVITIKDGQGSFEEVKN